MRAFYLIGLGAILAVLIHAAPAQAQLITFVAATGNDANACTVQANPCRTLQRGINAVLAGGEVRLLSELPQQGATIAKSLTVAGGGHTMIGVIVINNASAVVTLRGLSLTGRTTLAIGIKITSAAAVHIEDCTIERYTGRGMQVDAVNELFVTDTVSRDNGIDGIGIFATAATAMIVNSRFENNTQSGVYSVAANATITRSVASGNANGYYVENAGQMALEASTAHGNTFGVIVNTGSTGRISNSVVTNNSTGIYNGGTLLTRQNNTVSGNTTNTNGSSLTPLAGI